MTFQITIYSLLLAHNKYYVGQANDVDFRFAEHSAGQGAKWTRLHRPLEVSNRKVVTVINAREAMLYENWATLQLMEKRGWENVRGGDFLVVENHLLQERIRHIFDCKAGGIRVFIPKCIYLFGSSDEWLIYVLELCDGFYYVGSTKHLGKALGNHFDGRMNEWTRVNRVKRVAEWLVVTADSGKNYLDVKRQIFWEYKDRHGWGKVLGGERPPRS